MRKRKPQAYADTFFLFAFPSAHRHGVEQKRAPRFDLAMKNRSHADHWQR
jgi:hypothetical protein